MRMKRFYYIMDGFTEKQIKLKLIEIKFII